MTTSRAKGASFERLVAKELEQLTGVKTQRNLEQVRKEDQGDLIGFPGVTIECKYRRAAGLPDKKWWEQVCKAAKASNSFPVLIFRTGRSPLMVMTLMDMTEGDGTDIGLAFPVIMEMRHWAAAAGLALPNTGQPGSARSRRTKPDRHCL